MFPGLYSEGRLLSKETLTCSFQSVFLDVLQYYPDKLQEVSDLLVEKELRVRTPLEELDLLMANRENISADANCAASGQDTEPNGAAVETISANT